MHEFTQEIHSTALMQVIFYFVFQVPYLFSICYCSTVTLPFIIFVRGPKKNDGYGKSYRCDMIVTATETISDNRD
jgi:hypothetical protein